MHNDTYFQVKRFNAPLNFSDVKSQPIKNDTGIIVDYRDVIVEGYLSTFLKVTPQDRMGDYVLNGAFTETIKSFIKNPVAQVDHENRVFANAGQFTELSEDERGLKVAILLTNAPDMVGLRVRVVEKSIRALSMGGFFYYLEDGYGIFKVDLFEGSFVAIPMNPDALFTVRSLDLSDFKMLSKKAIAENAANQLLQSTIAGRIVANENIGKALDVLGVKQEEVKRRQKCLRIGGIKISKGAKRQ